MNLLKKTSYLLLLILFVISMIFAFNYKVESVFADTYSISIGSTNYTSLQDAIDAVPYDTETEIALSGNISVDNTISIAGDSALGNKLITFNIVADTNIVRENATAFTMFSISLAKAEFKTSNNSKLVIDYNTTTINSGNYSIIRNSDRLTLNGNITVKNNFINSNGSGITTTPISSTTLNGVTFTNIKCNDKGGCIFNEGTLKIDNCIFDNNAGGSFGGAIFCLSGNSEIKNSTFSNNVLSGKTFTYETNYCFGAAIAVYNGTHTIENCNFVSNNSHIGTYIDSNLIKGHGGAIAVTNGILNILSSIFTDNNAYNGGAIAVTGGTLNVTDMTMNGNTARVEGGGLYVNGGTVVIENGTIGNNSSMENKAQDIYWATTNVNSKLSANVTSQNMYSIYSSVDLRVGENFALGNNSYINLEQGKIIYVKEKLNTTSKILLSVNGATDETLVGEELIYFASQSAISTDIFSLSNPDYSLVLPENYTSLAEPYLFVSIEYSVEFYQYYDSETNTYYNKIGDTQKVAFGGSATPPTLEQIGTRTGYQFGGWNTNDYENVTSSMKVYGIWGEEIVITFKVFDDNSNSYNVLTTNTIVSGTRLNTLPDIPDKTGYTVNAPYWAYDTQGNTAYSNETLSEATTLYAIYVPDILKVSFIREDGTKVEIEVDYNSAFTQEIPVISEKEGYNQVAPYWAYDENGENRFDPSAIIKTSFDLYEIYTINKYEIKFYVNYYHNLALETGKESLETKFIGSIVINYNDVITNFPSLPYNVAYTQNSVIWDYNNAPISENLDIYGDIDINVYLVEFEASGEVIYSETVEHGKTLTKVPEIPEKIGHTQTAPIWQAESVETADTITANTTFVAKYTKNVYTVTFILPDNTQVLRYVNHGESVNADNIISKNFGELIRFDKSLDNITENCEIYVSKVNLFMWLMIALGAILLLILIIILIKIIKKKKLQSIARKGRGHRSRVGPYVSDDD